MASPGVGALVQLGLPHLILHAERPDPLSLQASGVFGLLTQAALFGPMQGPRRGSLDRLEHGWKLVLQEDARPISKLARLAVILTQVQPESPRAEVVISRRPDVQEPLARRGDRLEGYGQDFGYSENQWLSTDYANHSPGTHGKTRSHWTVEQRP